VDTWVWVTVGAVAALGMVGGLAILGSWLNERFEAATQVEGDADADLGEDAGPR
jgi:hypothetical protein